MSKITITNAEQREPFRVGRMHYESVAAHCDHRLSQTLEFLREMVGINSFTENAAGVNRLGELIASNFAPLGFTPTFVASSHEAYGDHLVLRGPSRPGAPTIALVSHLDTVFTEEEEIRNHFHWRPEGSRIYGPGTNDIKGGTALIHLILSVMASELPAVFEAVNWVVLLNACEEVISADFRQVCREHLPPETLACLVFEADGGGDGEFKIVTARKGRATFLIEVEGRGAHAGSSHERGANAVVELAGIVTQLSRLTSYEEKLTVNVGSIQGGTVPNRVPHFAQARLEMRAFDPDVYERAKAAILAMAGPGTISSHDADQHRCEVKVTMDDETVPWPRNAGTEQLAEIWKEAAGDFPWPVTTEERGGLSDGNVVYDLFPTLDGLGPRGDDCHCSERSADGRKQQEWVDVTSIVPKAALNICAIERLVGRGRVESK